MDATQKTRPSPGEVIEALHHSEINGSVSWMFDGTWSVAIGDELNGIMAETTVGSAQEAAEWLRTATVQPYPQSPCAKLAKCRFRLAQLGGLRCGLSYSAENRRLVHLHSLVASLAIGVI
jgi:hypothetical protein